MRATAASAPHSSWTEQGSPSGITAPTRLQRTVIACTVTALVVIGR